MKQFDEKTYGKMQVAVIDSSQVLPNPYQPRRVFDALAMQELADSIRQHGVMQPISVRRMGAYYELIAGERRWRAAKLAGFREVPVIVREYTRQQTMEIALIENVQRADLNPIEEAKAYQMLIQEFGLRQEDVAERVAKNRATITNSMRLLKLELSKLDVNMFSAVDNSLINDGCGLYRGRLILPYEHLSRFQNDLID